MFRAHRLRHSTQICRNEHASLGIRHFWGGAESLHRVNESRPSGQNLCTRCIDSKMACWEYNSRFSNHDFRVIPVVLEHGGSDSLHRLQRFECEGGAQNHCTDEHILALHELKQIRCTGKADSSRAHLDLRPPPKTFNNFQKWRFQLRCMPFSASVSS